VCPEKKNKKTKNHKGVLLEKLKSQGILTGHHQTTGGVRTFYPYYSYKKLIELNAVLIMTSFSHLVYSLGSLYLVMQHVKHH
jgi:hypothetical protein